MIRCVITIDIKCDPNDDNNLVMDALHDGDVIESALRKAGFVFTDIALAPCDGVKVFEKEYK